MDKKPNLTVWGTLNRLGFQSAPPMVVHRLKSYTASSRHRPKSYTASSLIPPMVVHRLKSYTAHGRTPPQVDTVQSRTPPQIDIIHNRTPPQVVHRLKKFLIFKVVHRPHYISLLTVGIYCQVPVKPLSLVFDSACYQVDTGAI